MAMAAHEQCNYPKRRCTHKRHASDTPDAVSSSQSLHYWDLWACMPLHGKAEGRQVVEQFLHHLGCEYIIAVFKLG